MSRQYIHDIKLYIWQVGTGTFLSVTHMHLLGWKSMTDICAVMNVYDIKIGLYFCLYTVAL